MKKLLYTLLLCLPLGVLGQAFTQRTNGTFTPTDPFLNVPKGLYIPRVCDTIGAVQGLDTLGAIIFDKCNHKLWVRDTTAGGHKWTEMGSGAYTFTNGLRRLPGNIIKLGTGNHTFLDSTVIIQYQARKAIGSTNMNVLLTNVGLDSMQGGAAFWQNNAVTGASSQQPKGLNVVMTYKEAWGDTMLLQYGGPILTYHLLKYDTVSPRFAQPGGKTLILPYTGVQTTNRIFLPKDSVNIYTGANGFQSSLFAGDWAIGDSCGYNVYTYNNAELDYPLSVFASHIDLQRNISRTRKRKITGNGVAGFFADYKDYQGNINPTTFQDSAYHSKIYDFFSAGEREGNYPVDPSTTKTYILGISKNDTVVGFYSAQKWDTINSVNNGYGFVQKGPYDYNWYEGRLRLGGIWPTRANGGLRYNLEAPGSTRTDTIFNLFQQLDSTGRIVFASKNSVQYDAGGFSRFLIDGRATIDSNGNGNTIPGGAFMFRNYTDYKTPTIPQNDLFDGRAYFNLSANRSATVGNCFDCPNNQFYGYSRIVLATGSRLASNNLSTTLPHTIYLARNELTATGSSHASTLDLVSFGGVFQLRSSSVDSLRSATQFRDFGLSINNIGRIGMYASYVSSVSNLSNADSVFGFYQSSTGIRNKFYGTMELPSLSAGGTNIVTADANGKLFIGQTTTVTPTISTGTSAPATTPAKVGDMYIDTTGKKLYIATGTSSSADWTITN